MDWYSLPGFYEPFSCFSHLAGAVVFAVLTVFLLRPVWGHRVHFWSVAPFAFSAVATLAISGVYHMFVPGGLPRSVMLRLDVSAIFLLIAASFLPVHGILFRGWRRWSIPILLLIFAIFGISLRVVFFDRIPDFVGTALFLGMGWLGALTAYWLAEVAGWRQMTRIIAGGCLYTLGALSNGFNWPTIIPYVWGPHETFHLAVLAGLGCHWSFVHDLIAGRVPLSRREGDRDPDLRSASFALPTDDGRLGESVSWVVDR